MILLTVAAALVAGMSASAQSLDDALQKIANFKFGEDRENESVVNDLVRKADNAGGDQRKAAEQSLLALLKKNPSPDCVDFLCRQLMVIGTEASVPVLEPMLTKDEKSADWARYTLERISGDAVDKAFIKAVTQTSGRARIGIINSLGNRKSAAAVGTLATFTADKDKDIAAAAITALGQISGDDADAAIAKARGGEYGAAADDAYITSAAAYVAQGKDRKAAKIYEELYGDAKSAPRVRGAAVSGLAKVQPAKTQETLLALLKGDDKYLRAVATGLLRRSDDKGVPGAVAQLLPSLKPEAQVQAIAILEQRHEASSLAAVTTLASSGDASVKVAALHAMGVFGDASAVAPLLAAATGADEDAKKAANDGLDALRGDDVDAKMLAAMTGADAKTRSVLIRSLATRGAKSALPALYEAAGDADDSIRAKALDALGTLAGPEDLSKLIDLLGKLIGNSAQAQAESAVVAVSQKVRENNARAKGVLDALATAKDENVRVALTKVAGRIGDASALPVLRTLAGDAKEAAVQEAAVRGLCDWTTTETLDDLRKMAAESKNDTFRSLAYGAMIRVARMEGGPDLDTKIKIYTEALSEAKTPDDKRMALAGLANIGDPRALELAKKLENDEAVKAEAKQAIEQISKAIGK